jgi:hypothetical protein
MGQANRERRRSKEKQRKRARSAAPRPTASQPGQGSGHESVQQAVRRALGEQQTSEEVLRAILSTAFQAHLARDGGLFANAVARLVERPDLDGWRAYVERTLTAYLERAVTAAWHGGWQPADLARLAGRQLDGHHVRLLGDAIAAELRRYAAATIDPRWAAQLDELEAKVWWPADRTYLRAWCELPRNDWVTVMPAAMQVLGLLGTLPKLEQLGPVPGTARPPISKRAREGKAVDERVLSRVRALLAKAEATNSTAEAEAFTAGAQERMARHSIDAAMLAATAPDDTQKPSGRRIGIDNPYEASKASLLQAVAQANRCRAVWSKEFGFSTVVGFEPDLNAVETLFTSLLIQAIRAMTSAGSRTDKYGRSRTRAFRQSFLTAYAARIGERLLEVTGAQTQAASAEPEGRNLLPVLASRDRAVDDVLTEMFPRIVQNKRSSVSDAEGWHSGRGAADQATLHTAQPLPR